MALVAVCNSRRSAPRATPSQGLLGAGRSDLDDGAVGWRQGTWLRCGWRAGEARPVAGPFFVAGGLRRCSVRWSRWQSF